MFVGGALKLGYLNAPLPARPPKSGECPRDIADYIELCCSADWGEKVAVDIIKKFLLSNALSQQPAHNQRYSARSTVVIGSSIQ